MRSISVSDIRPVSQSNGAWNSSTGFRQDERHRRPSAVQRSAARHAHSSDLSLLPKASVPRLVRAHAQSSRSSGTERNESVYAARDSGVNSNGKDSLISRMRLLLTVANSPEIDRFADELRHVSAAADEQVMDRGAEGAAGGCDAV